ncbi:MAG: Putative cyclase, partial [Olavius algarvensis Gamma 1 endosymbiont]
DRVCKAQGRYGRLCPLHCRSARFLAPWGFGSGGSGGAPAGPTASVATGRERRYAPHCPM